ncbi:MAG: FtsX-like permease family protein [Isosphaeraceae bacterium]
MAVAGLGGGGGVRGLVVLMFVENGFRNALLDNMVAVVSAVDGDLFVTHQGRYILSQPVTFPRRRLELVRGVPGVRSVQPFYLDAAESTRWRNLLNGQTRPIRVLAVPAGQLGLLTFLDPQGRDALDDRPDVALSDERSKPVLYGPIGRDTQSELNGRRIRVVGRFELGTDFRSNGTLLMTESNLLRYFPLRQPTPDWGDTRIDVGVVRLEPGADPEPVRDAVRRNLPPDVIVLTRAELMRKEQNFWEKVTPVGVVFDIGLVMGLFVGSAICYQVLFGEVADRLAEFATLKAMGYRDRDLGAIIVKEAVYLAALGYGAGLLLSLGLFRWLEAETGLNMILGLSDALLILGLTVFMCVAAGLLAARKLAAADPADLFG